MPDKKKDYGYQPTKDDTASRNGLDKVTGGYQPTKGDKEQPAPKAPPKKP